MIIKTLNTIFLSCLLILLLINCQDKTKKTLDPFKKEIIVKAPKYSLSQWSFNRELFSGKMTTIDFIKVAGEMDYEGVEYVSQFFQDKVEDFVFLDSLTKSTNEAGVKSLLIMVDDAGNLGASNMGERNLAIENCKKWVLAAKYLGCNSIRVNAHGDGTPEEMKNACADGIGRLAAWSQKQGIDIIIENHGGISSNGKWLAELLKELQEFGVGSYPDFGNWCTLRENGQLWGGACTERYDRYKGLKELVPYAKSLSVKSFAFDDEGNETSMDYAKIFEIVQASGYNGYLGIEFAGHDIPSLEGINKTRELVEKVWKKNKVYHGASESEKDGQVSY